MPCLEVCKIFITNRNTKNNLFSSHSHCYELQHNLLGQLLLRQKGIYISKANHQNHYKYCIRPRDSCREIFKNMQIMTLYCQYIYSLLLFTVSNKHLFTVNNEIHKYNTRNNNNLHPALANLTK